MVSYQTYCEAYAQFTYKVVNREYEFDVLGKYLRKLPTIINILSFPHEYAYERYFIGKTGKTLNVFSAERIHPSDPTSATVQAKRFIRDYPLCSVYLPAYHKKGGILLLPSGQVSLSNILYGETSMAKVDFSRFSVVQQLVDASTVKFNVADLDHVSSYNVHVDAENQQAWDALAPGGILLVTLSMRTSRSFSNVQKRYKDMLEPEDLATYSYHNLRHPPKHHYYAPTTQMLEKFGLSNIMDADTLIITVNNVLEEYVKIFGKAPAYANVYRGGSSSMGTPMLRAAWVK